MSSYTLSKAGHPQETAIQTSRRILLEKYWGKVENRRLNRENTYFQKEDDAAYAARKKRNIRFRAYINRVMTKVPFCNMGNEGAYVFFDSDGYCLKLFGNSDILDKLQAAGITKRTLWTFETIGPNAVSVGLREKKSLYSVGSENYIPLLEPYAIYFSPIIMEEFPSGNTTKYYGGVAFICPVEYHIPDHLTSVLAIGNEIILSLHTANIIMETCEEASSGLIFFDISTYNGNITVLYHNKKIFEILGIEPADMYFLPAEKLFDPLPKNKEFWTMLNEKKEVENHLISLSIQGNERTYSITTFPYSQARLQEDGIRCFITTPQELSKSISKKMGNHALLSFDDIIGQANCMQSAKRRANLLSQIDNNVMLLGESGVGKDIFAQAIHNASLRKDKPFIAINCGAIPKDLIESELFGYESGAFTGAKRQGNIGKFELANGGTIFLDEVAELPLDLQATLLRVVEQKQYMKVGGNKTITADVKIISATNADIMSMIEQKRFRADLYYRLGMMKLVLPPLRERENDILLLANHFIRAISRRTGKSEMVLSEDAKELLMSCPWQGNVRELQNLMECIVQLYPGEIITSKMIMENMGPVIIHPNTSTTSTNSRKSLPESAPLTKEDIENALIKTNNNKAQAASLLGISRRKLYREIDRFGLSL